MTIHLAQLTPAPHHPDAVRDRADRYDLFRTLNRAAQLHPGPDGLEPFLWRSEGDQVLVQSERPLDWEALPDGWLSAVAQRSWEPEATLQPGQQVHFRVAANPVVTRAPAEHTGPARGHRKRFGLRTEPEQLAWIQRQCTDRLGLADVSAAVTSSGVITTSRKKAHTITTVVAEFTGTAVIQDPIALAAGIRRGIGHTKMLGLGLFTTAPV
jgi:CRISPR-associated protein Cas6/Cse3/CasE subtype I-E